MKPEDLTSDIPTLNENYASFLEKPLRLGFVEGFPVVDEIEPSDTLEITTKVRGYKVVFKVMLVKLKYGPTIKDIVTGIVTEKLTEVNKERLSSITTFGSHLYHDTASVMERAVVKMANKHNLKIYNKICSWPYAKAVVGKLNLEPNK